MSAEIDYLVIEFTSNDGGGLAIVPSNWLDGRSCCLWPPYKDQNRVLNAARKKEIAGSEWKSYTILPIWFRSGDWEVTYKKYKRLFDHSGVESTDPEEMGRSKRRRRSPQRFDRSPSLSRSPSPQPSTSVRRRTFGRLPSASSDSSENDHLDTNLVIKTPPPPPPPAPTMHQVTCRPTENLHPFGALEPTINRIYTTLEEIKVEQRNIRRALAQLSLNMKNSAASSTVCSPCQLPRETFPLKTQEQVEDFERKIVNNNQLKSEVIQHLLAYNGKNINEDTRQKVDAVFANSLAITYNLTGKGTQQKRAFQQLGLYEVVFDAVRKSKPDACLKEYRVALTNWFDGAKDREGGRKRRNNSASHASASVLGISDSENSSV